MYLENLSGDFFITILTLSFLFTFNKYVNNPKLVFTINIIVLIESLTLTFFSPKYNTFFALMILMTSLYFIAIQKEHLSFIFERKIEGLSIFPIKFVQFFPFIGYFLIFLIIIYESIGDFNISTDGVLIFLVSLILIFYTKIPEDFNKESDFLLVFLSLISLLYVFTKVIYKLRYNLIGSYSGDNWLDEDLTVYYLLGRPLSSLLNILGYNAIAHDKYIGFEDQEAGIFREVGIAESCSGIDSIIIFTSALASYLAVEKGLFDLRNVPLFLLGLIICYLSNIVRMALIIIVGHHYGIESMLWTHKYAGWIIFSLIIFTAWYVKETIEKSKIDNTH